MNMMHTIKDWTSEHTLHRDVHELRLMVDRLVRDPAFWLVVALLACVALLIFVGYFAKISGPQIAPPMYHVAWPYYR